jgi:hypothetical protein
MLAKQPAIYPNGTIEVYTALARRTLGSKLRHRLHRLAATTYTVPAFVRLGVAL